RAPRRTPSRCGAPRFWPRPPPRSRRRRKAGAPDDPGRGPDGANPAAPHRVRWGVRDPDRGPDLPPHPQAVVRPHGHAGGRERRPSDTSNEAATKYFRRGAFASAILLYRIALTSGATGTTNLGRIADAPTTAEGTLPAGLLLAGMAMILIGFAFKVALVPFHM